MLTRRKFLRDAGIVAGGTLAAMTLGQRLIIPSGRISTPAFNDEFVADSGEWTVAGSNDVDFGVTTPGKVHMESGMAIHRARVPSLPFTVEASCTSIQYDNIDTTFANATLAIADNVNPGSTGPKFYGLEWDVDILGSIAIYDGLFANYAATPSHLGTKTSETAGLTLEVPHKQRLVVNSGTDVDLYYAYEATDWEWTLYASARNPSVTVEAIMLISFGCTTEWDYIRFS